MKLVDQTLNLNLTLAGKEVLNTDRNRIIDSIKLNLEKVPKNSPILILQKDPVRFLYSFLMALDFGLIPISLPTETTEFQLEHLRKSIKGAAVFNNQDINLSKETLTESHTNCYACLTSGTTGISKLCYLNLDNALLNSKLHADSLGVNKDNTVIQTLPLYHSFGIISYIFAWIKCGFTLDLNHIFLGLKTLSKRNLKNSVIHLSPSQLRFMLKEKTSPPIGIDIISIGGGSIDNKSLKEIKRKLPNTEIYTTYGLTEAGPRVTTGLWSDHEEGFIGSSLKRVETAVLDSDSKISRTGVGKLLIKSPTLKLNIKENELIDGWLITRDQVRINENSEVFFITREDDLINFGGISLYPSDIELVIKQHPKVVDAIVLKRKSELYEEEPILIVEPTVEPSLLREFLKGKLASHQIPKLIYSYESLPRNSLEKIDRKQLYKTLEQE
ncbi:MAG: acyl--CoA ligase [Bacteriovoracaceae bacterium]|nr:acyl--CoA ligase [Bacteriovoracaceae bacterium]